MSDVNYVIRDGAVVVDEWKLIPATDDAADTADAALPAGKVIVPLRVWLAQRGKAHHGQIGVWLDGHNDASLLAESINQFAVIAVNFPKFADGRGYSTATLLRTRYGFTGELRAIGDVLRDQLFYLQRVGFNAFAVRADKDIHDAVQALKDFTVAYQGSVDRPLPLFRHRSQRPLHTQTQRPLLETTQ